MKHDHLWNKAKAVRICPSAEIVGNFDIGFDPEIPEATKDALMHFVYWVEDRFDLPITLWVDFKYNHYLRNENGKPVGYLFYWAEGNAYPVFDNPDDIPVIELPVRTDRWTMEEILTSFIEAISLYFSWLTNHLAAVGTVDPAEIEEVLQEYLKDLKKEPTVQIRPAGEQDLEALLALFAEARGTIAQLGIDQWQDGYPSEPVILEDIRKEQSYLLEQEGELGGTFVLVDTEPTYDVIYDGQWLTGEGNYLAIHRVAIFVACRGKGIPTVMMDYAAEEARSRGKNSLRIDTHEGNLVMRRMLEKQGFHHCGKIKLPTGAWRVAYEKVL